MPTQFIPETPEQLIELFKTFVDAEEPIKPENIKYVIYVRKSTDNKKDQLRSIPQQLEHCIKLAEDTGLIVGDIIEEKESAKYPDIRPKFRKMLDDIRAGKYQGIIAWHPDRLARNMKDAGEIIDLIDQKILLDLKFKTMYFENTPSGKLMLGILFAMSKEYTDKLSIDIRRGNNSKLDMGKHINRNKHGYYKDHQDYFRPDGQNYLYIKEAFRMRIERKKLDEIAKYLNNVGYTKLNSSKKGAKMIVKMDKQKLEKLFKDPFYCGVDLYGERIRNLQEFYDFIPVITVSEFMKLNKIDKKGLIKLFKSDKSAEDSKANFLRGKVLCSECGVDKDPEITTGGSGGLYFYFRCRNVDCKKRNESTRASVVREFVVRYLKQKPFTSEESFKSYQTEMTRIKRFEKHNDRSDLNALVSVKTRIEKRIDEVKNELLNEKDEDVKVIWRDELKELQKDLKEYEIDVREQKTKLESIKILEIDDFKKFSELLEKLYINIEYSGDTKFLDVVISKIFANFTVNQKSVTGYKLECLLLMF